MTTLKTNGNWTAINKNGETIFESNGQVISGDSQLVLEAGASLTITAGAIASNVLAEPGPVGTAYITIQKGGILENSVINNGSLTVEDGAISRNNTLNSTPEYVKSGGISDHETIITTGNNVDLIGTTFVQAGGTIIDPTVNNGGTLTVFGQGNETSSQANPLPPFPTGERTVIYGVWYASTDEDGQTIYSNGITTLPAGTLVTVGANATLIITTGTLVTGLLADPGAAATAYITVQKGSILENSVINNGALTLDSGAIARNNIQNSTNEYIKEGAKSENEVITTSGNNVDLIGSTYVYAGGTISCPTVKDNGSLIVYGGGEVNATCFLEGSLIRTEFGDIPVETVRPSVYVLCHTPEQGRFQKVIWCGFQEVKIDAHASRNNKPYPICILKDAFSPGVPFQDLWLTAEHCVYNGQKLIPIHTLVNNVTIFYDTSLTHYRYFHIETENHAIIYANGLHCETYLDTGNRALFSNSQQLVRPTPPLKEWNKDAIAPLARTQADIEPYYTALKRRATLMGMSPQTAQPEITSDPALHLLTNKGSKLLPLRKTICNNEGYKYSFLIPPGTTSVYIMSRTFMPAEIIGPYTNDRRHLGVEISTIHAFTREKTYILRDHLTTPTLEGWAEREDNTSFRWTTGKALLNLEGLNMASCILNIQAVTAQGYIVENNPLDKNKEDAASLAS